MKNVKNILWVTGVMLAVSGITAAFVILERQSSVTTSNLTAATPSPSPSSTAACTADKPATMLTTETVTGEGKGVTATKALEDARNKAAAKFPPDIEVKMTEQADSILSAVCNSRRDCHDPDGLPVCEFPPKSDTSVGAKCTTTSPPQKSDIDKLYHAAVSCYWEIPCELQCVADTKCLDIWVATKTIPPSTTPPPPPEKSPQQKCDEWEAGARSHPNFDTAMEPKRQECLSKESSTEQCWTTVLGPADVKFNKSTKETTCTLFLGCGGPTKPPSSTPPVSPTTPTMPPTEGGE